MRTVEEIQQDIRKRNAICRTYACTTHLDAARCELRTSSANADSFTADDLAEVPNKK